MIIMPTEILRCTVSQEIRVILPPVGFLPDYTLSAPKDVHAGLEGADPHPECFPTTMWKPCPNRPMIDCMRRVQVITPQNPRTYFDLDKPPEWYGINRTYKLPPARPGQLTDFWLGPKQFMVAAAHEGIATMTLIVEYYPPKHTP